MSSILVLAIPTLVLNSCFFHNFLPSNYFTHIFLTRSTYKPNLLQQIFNYWFGSSQISGIRNPSALGLHLLTTLSELSLSDLEYSQHSDCFLASLLFSFSIKFNNIAAHPNLLEIQSFWPLSLSCTLC